MQGEPVPNATGVYIVRIDPTNGHVWRVSFCKVDRPGNSDDNITVYLENPDGSLMTGIIPGKIRAFQGWPEIDTPLPQSPALINWTPDDNGVRKADAFSPGYWNPAKIDHGPYFIWIQDHLNPSAESEYAGGFGPILNFHFHAEVHFRWTPVPPEPPPTPPPAPSAVDFWHTARAAFGPGPLPRPGMGAMSFEYGSSSFLVVVTPDGGLFVSCVNVAGSYYLLTPEEVVAL